MPGQVTPQLSRDSSTSSLNQQAPSQWKGEERSHEMISSNAANPNMNRNFPSAPSRGMVMNCDLLKVSSEKKTFIA